MALSRLGGLLLLCSVFLFTSSVHAVDLSEYQVYEADYDDDGDIDYLLKLSPEEVEIPYDINLQIERSAQQYLLINDDSGNFSVSLTSSPIGDWQQIEGEVTTLNYIDGGLSEIVIKTYGSDPQVIVAGQSSEGVLSAGNAIASDSLRNGALASIVDINGDGLDEVIVSGDDINTLSASNVSLEHDAVQNFAANSWAGNDGAAHAAINILLPKELGPVPNISLQYSSNSGNGPVGMGFNLTGTSKIHYCKPSADVNDTMAATPFTDEERICLNGQYLVQTEGASRYEHDATYMTEVSNHSRLRYKNDVSQNQFEMETKGGGKLIFAHARKHDQNLTKTIEWYLSRAEDEFGNGYDYTYKYATQHEYLPLLKKIKYGTITVDFSWEARANKTAYVGSKITTYNDESIGHRGGATTILRDRLAGMSIKRNSIELRSYILHYGVNYNSQSQLEKVDLCTLEAACESTVFDWYEGEAVFNEPNLLGNFIDKEPEQKAQFLDVDGDGFVDIMYPNIYGSWTFRLGSKAGFKSPVDTGISIGVGAFADYAVPIKAGLDHIQGLIVADSKVSNIQDKALACSLGGHVYIYHSSEDQIDDTKNYSGLNCGRVPGGTLEYVAVLNWYILTAEFKNGVFKKFTFKHLGTDDGGTGLNTLGNRLHVTDINRDGLQDIVVTYESQIVDYLYRANVWPWAEEDGERIGVFIASADSEDVNHSNVKYREFTILEPVLDLGSDLMFVDLNHDGILDIEFCSKSYLKGFCIQYLLTFHEDKYEEYMACSENPFCTSPITYTSVITAVEERQTQSIEKLVKTVTNTDANTGESSTLEIVGPKYYADFNGDGTTDLMSLTTSGMIVYFNVNSLIDSDRNYSSVNYPQINGDPFKVSLIDFNNDGLLDVLAEDEGILKVYQAIRVNAEGSHSRNIQYVEKSIFNSAPMLPSSFAGIEYGALFDSEPIGDLSLRYLPVLQYKDMPTSMDYNGDGVTDLVYFDGNNLYSTQRENGFVNSRKLKKVTDSFGNSTEFTYQNSQLEANIDYDDIRFPYVNIANTTGLVASMASGNVTSGYRTTNYEFVGAQYHLQGRGFMGYGKRIDTYIDKGIRSEQLFEQNFPLTGAIKQTNQYWLGGDEPSLLFENNTSWSIKDLSQFGEDIIFPYPRNQENHRYGLNGIKIGKLSTENSFDNFGNLLSQYNYNYNGNGNGTAYFARVYSRNRYTHLTDANVEIQNELDNWRLNFSTSTTRNLFSGGTSISQVTTLTPKGDTHQVDTKTDPSGLIHSYSYNDTNGTLLSETLSSTESATYPITPRASFINSNFEHGYLPKTLTNASGYSASVIYDDLWHQPISQTSVQGLTQTTQYDNWGLPFKAVSPEGVISLNLTNNCTASCPSGAYFSSTQLQMHKSQKGFLAPPQVTYFDALGRVLREETQNANGEKIYQDYQYDLYDRLTQASLPYINGTNTADIKWTTYDEYDLLDRILQTTQPYETGTVTHINSYLGTLDGTVHTQNITKKLPTGESETQTTRTTTNILGQITRVENNQSGLINTYQYDGLNNLVAADVISGQDTLKQVSATYNNAGFKTQINDPDTGVYNYNYDALGLMRYQGDARGNTYVYEYDVLNQQTQSTLNGELDATWDYSETIPGLLEKRYKQNFNEQYQYDDLHRLKKVTTQLINLADRQFNYEYDAAGRMHTTRYPSGFSIEATYNPLGFLTTYQNPKTKQSYWQAQDMDAFGNWVGVRMGNGITTQRDYDPASGLLKTLTSTKTSSGDIQSQTYNWDSLGNLHSRTQNSLTETFGYDGVNRLTTATTTGLASGTRTLSYDYDALGNMTYKSDLSDINGMAYGTATTGPSRLQSVTKDGAPLYSYKYDTNGNMTQRGNVNATYTPANKPEKIWLGSGINYAENSFLYDTDEQRFYQAQIQGTDTARETYYYGSGYEEIFDTDPSTQLKIHKQKAYVGGVLIHTYTQSSDPLVVGKVADIQYLHHDHLGSTQTITDTSGSVLQSMAYDPFGRARQSNWEDIDTNNGNPDWSTIGLNHTSAGFTGHEMLADFELIHMGGRLYDPIAGRMMSADPFIQAPFNGQSYNRYSYVWNNPLSANDPSGYNGVLLGDLLLGEIAISGGFAGFYDPIVIPPPNLNDSFRDEYEFDFEEGIFVGGNSEAGNQSSTITGSEVIDVATIILGPTVGSILDAIFGSTEGSPVAPQTGSMTESLPAEIDFNALMNEGVNSDLNDLRPVVGGGADLNNLSAGEVQRIQNAANRTNQSISVVGSRAAGNATIISDWDYIMSGNSAQRHSASSSVPRGTQGGEQNSMGNETGIDLWQSYNPSGAGYSTVNTNQPFITFHPR